ncbi:MAG: protein kinase [Actinomycetota bacterium]
MIEIAGYEDLEVLGSGGFAVVYKAHQVSIGREVAIKVLSDPSPDADLLRRFTRESKAVGALSWHPNIAAVLDAGTTEQGQAFIVFELLSGGALEDRIIHNPMPWARAVTAMIQVADAVEAAHRAEVLHRDIKPANILMNRLGDAKLADFGIASMQDGNKTETGTLAATLAHAAPELFDGTPASPLTDVYALGSTLHNLVSGRPPFSHGAGETFTTVIRRILNDPPPRIPATLAPPELETVISYSLAKQPDQRPPSAAAFGKQLQALQRSFGLSVTAMPVGDQDNHESAQLPPAISTFHQPATPPPQNTPPPTPLQDLTGHPISQPNPVVPPQGPISQPVPAVPPQGPISQPVPAVPPQGPISQPVPAIAPHHGAISQPVPAVAPPQHAYVPHVQPKRSGRLGWVIAIIVALGVIAGGAAAAYYFLLRPAEPIAVTAGGARITEFNAFEPTTIIGLPPDNALDQDTGSYWGIEPEPATGAGITGTTYVMLFEEPVRVVNVGIHNGGDTDLGRISEVRWATSISEFSNDEASTLTQRVPDANGAHMVAYGATTRQLVLLISDVHDEANPTAGIAEILVDVARPLDS